MPTNSDSCDVNNEDSHIINLSSFIPTGDLTYISPIDNKPRNFNSNNSNNNSSNNSNNDDDDDGKYSPDTVYYLQIMYIIAIIVWIAIISFLRLYETSFFGWLILLIPILFFLMAFCSLSGITREVEKFMFQHDFLQFGYIVIVVVLIWDKTIDDEKVFNLVSIGIVLLVLSMLDIWTTENKLVYMKHFQSIVQTIAAVVLIFVLFYYYTQHICGIESKKIEAENKANTNTIS